MAVPQLLASGGAQMTDAVAPAVGTHRSSPALVSADPSVHRGRALQPGPKESPDILPGGRVSGEFNVLAVLIEFQDVKRASANSPGRLSSELFNRTPGSSSVYNYYIENSYGSLKVAGTVTAVWYLSDYTMAEYGADGSSIDDKNGPIYRLVTEAVHKADADVDFSRFDRNSDGYIDHLCIVHSGQGQESSTNPNCIWSHKWYDYDEPKVDGVTAGPYTMLSEYSPVGTFAHELGHDIGLPDLYDYTGASYGAGVWDLMATGSWADNGNTPVHLSAWCKMKAGWLTLRDIDGTVDNLSLPAIEGTPVAYRLWIERPSEYYIIENRQRIGWDEFLPAGGMLIWHIDERITNNDDSNHRLVDLEEMDEASGGDSPIDAGDPWHDSENGFNPFSDPAATSYAGYSTALWVFRIGPPGPQMNFSVRMVDVDLAVAGLDYPMFLPEKVTNEIRAVVSNMGGREQSAIPVNMTVSRGEVLFHQTSVIPSLAPGQVTVLTWAWTPPKAGNYILTVRAEKANDAVPDNDEKTGVLRVTTLLFYDDVEKGAGSWEPGTNVPLIPGLWHMVNRTDAYGDSFSPNHSWWCGFDTTGKYTRGSQFIYYYLESPIIDLTRVDSAILAFHQRYDISTGLPFGLLADTAIIEGSANLGSTWKQLDSFTGNGGNWSAKMYDLTEFTQSMFRFRFVLKSNALLMGRGWYVDDIAVLASGNVYDVALGLSPNVTSALPLQTAYFNLTVNNAGNRQDTFELVSDGPESVAITMNRTVLKLGLFETGKVLVAARITGKAEAGLLLAFRITAVSKGNFHVSSAATGGMVALQEYALSLECADSPVHADPGAIALFGVNLTNLGNGRDAVFLRLAGQLAGCATLEQDNITLRPWELAQLSVTLAVPDRTVAGTELALCLTARSSAGPSELLMLKVLVNRVSGATLDAAGPHVAVRPGGTARFDLSLGNIGNQKEDFILSSDAPSGWRLAHDTGVPLGPFTKVSLSLDVTIPNDIFGGLHEFVVRAAAAGGGSANLTLAVDVVMPDVYLRDMKVSPGLMDEGATATLSMSIGNTGTTNASSVTVTLYDNGKMKKQWDLGKLAPGYQETITLSLKLGRGNHLLSAVASTPDRELSSTNNEVQVDARVRASSAFIPGPDGAMLAIAMFVAVLISNVLYCRRGQNS